MPFAGGLSETANGTLLFAVLLAVFYGFMAGHPPSWRRTLAKAGGVLLLALLAAVQGGPALLVAALLLSAAGDAFLAQNGERAFMAGLASFLLAHLAYVALFALSGEGVGLIVAEPWRIALGLAMLASVGLLVGLLWPALPGAMRGPVALYAAAILAMGLGALTVPVAPVVGGAVLFMASDGLLATGRFLIPPASPHHGWAQPAVWALYFSAQAMITLGVLLSF
ncbi:MAG: lysoplasmalogenase [Mesorhizobium sp.]|nr:lysoplasmalogenase [Mesorhizobium sp.]